MRRVLVVPGLAVRGYAENAVDALREAGYDAVLLTPPSWRGTDVDLSSYGQHLAREIDDDGRSVSVLVGLSVGTQAAAVTAAASPLVERLLLVSPTVDTAIRSRSALLATWMLRGEPGGPSMLFDQIPDWVHAGPLRIFRGFSSAVANELEKSIPGISAEITIIHSELDPITSHAYASRLAAEYGCRLLLVPNGPHSWPIDDAARFVALLDRMIHD